MGQCCPRATGPLSVAPSTSASYDCTIHPDGSVGASKDSATAAFGYIAPSPLSTPAFNPDTPFPDMAVMSPSSRRAARQVLSVPRTLRAIMHGVPLEELEREFHNIQMLPACGSTQIAHQNPEGNKYDILPYDHTRVELPSGAYINSSNIDVQGHTGRYLAAQAPMRSTADVFWEMVWSSRVSCIIMLTKTTEGGRTQCYEYWPSQTKPVHLDTMRVTCVRREVNADSTMEQIHMSVEHLVDQQTRPLCLFWFKVWPDLDVPSSAESIFSLRSQVNAYRQERGVENDPILVHCAAGVGRTGTYIALDVLLRQLETNPLLDVVDVSSVVCLMRHCRPHMCYTQDQYQFIHTALAAWATRHRPHILSPAAAAVSAAEAAVDD